MNGGLLQEVKRTVTALYPELAGEALFREGKISQNPEPSLKEKAASCTDCALHVGRRYSVYGEGSHGALVMFVGDAPSDQDDEAGRIFSDASGDLLDRMIGAMKLGVDSVYKTNLVKCRPPKARTPGEKEIFKCLPYLESELSQCEANVIVAMGETAARFFSRTDADIAHLRGSWHEYEGRRVILTHHPRDLLRDPSKKKDAWEDLKQVMKELGL